MNGANRDDITLLSKQGLVVGDVENTGAPLYSTLCICTEGVSLASPNSSSSVRLDSEVVALEACNWFRGCLSPRERAKGQMVYSTRPRDTRKRLPATM